MDVIVKHRKTGIEKTMTKKMADMLSSRYQILSVVIPGVEVEMNKKPNPVQENLTELEKLRKEYESLFGRAPHHKLKEEKLKLLIADQKMVGSQKAE